MHIQKKPITVTHERDISTSAMKICTAHDSVCPPKHMTVCDTVSPQTHDNVCPPKQMIVCPPNTQQCVSPKHMTVCVPPNTRHISQFVSLQTHDCMSPQKHDNVCPPKHICFLALLEPGMPDTGPVQWTVQECFT